MPKKFCPKCGKEDVEFVSGFCFDCYVKDHPNILQAESIVVDYCPQCFRIRDNKKWIDADGLEDFIRSKVHTKLSDPKVELNLVESDSKKGLYDVKVTGKLGGKEVSLSQRVLVKMSKEQCPVCGKKQSTFHAAKIQLRCDDETVREAFNIVRNENRAYIAKDRDAEIFRFEQIKGGADIYFGSAKAAKQCIKALQQFHPLVKETFKLVGMDRHTNKKKYKVTYSVKL